MLPFERSSIRWVLAAAVLAVIVVYSVSAGLLGVGTLSFAVPEKVTTSSTNVFLNPSSWSLLTVPCPWNETWCVNDDPPLHKYRILVDLGHAERVKVDGITSTNLDKSSNSRIFDWQDWAKDMRAQGYEVNVLTKKPVTASDLINADLFIVAQPDKGKSGPVYFTAEEKDAIACFVLRGNTLLVMAQQFMGGKDQTTYNGDMKTTYASADVVNDLLEGIHVEGRFTEGKVSGDVLDLMDSKNGGTQVFSGKVPDIWLPAGNLKPEMKSATFAYFHGLSVEPGTTSWLVRADSTTFTSPKNTKYSPVVQPEGSLPVAIGVNGLGCGKVYLYGDPSAWQKESYIGKVYSNTKYHEQEAARVLVSRMLSFNRTCGPCEEQAQAQATQPVPTVTRTRLRVTVTPSESGDCTSCTEECKSLHSGSTGMALVGMVNCIAHCPGMDFSGFSTSEGSKICGSCAEATFPTSSNPNPNDASGGYANCIEQNGCSCPPSENTCDTCIEECNADNLGNESTSMSNRMSCLNNCYSGGYKLGKAVITKCQYCWDQASASGETGSAEIDVYSQCLMDQDCTCPTIPRTGDCNTCIDACNSKGLSGNALKTCFSGCGEGLCDTAWTTCNAASSSIAIGAGNYKWVTDKTKPTETSSFKKENEHVVPSNIGDTSTPGTCYAIAMQTSGCACGDLTTFCAGNCPAGETEVIGADGTSWCVTGTLDAAACDQQCPGPASGSLDSCGVCRCMGTIVSQGCSLEDCPEGTTAGMVDGSCMCTRSVLSECADAICSEGMTAAPDANGNCICTGSMLVNPGDTKTQSACLDCYKDCIQSSSTGATGTDKFNHLYGTAKTSETLVTTCQKKCDTQFKTTIASCVCANTQCEEGETATPTADLSCNCIQAQTGSGTTIDIAALQSQWNEHHEGAPVSTGTGSQQKPIGGIIPIPR